MSDRERVPGRRRRVVLLIAALAAWFAVFTLWISSDHEAESLVWQISVDASGLGPDGGIGTDAGTVRLIGGEVAVFSASLVACPHGHGWFSFLGAAPAWAGHGDDDGDGRDLTAVRGPVVVDLTESTLTPLGDALSEEPDYCELFVSLSGSNVADRLAGEAELTVWFEIEVSEAGETHTVVVSSDEAWGDSIVIDAWSGSEATVTIDIAVLLAAVDVDGSTIERERSVLASLFEAIGLAIDPSQ